MWPGVRPFPDVDPGEPIFGYTFQQPYGTAIVDGPKRDENRPKPPPARLRGRAFWIAVHAGATFYDGATEAGFRRPRVGHFTGAALWPACPDFAALPMRCIIGAARVVGWEGCGNLDSRRPWAFGPWVWCLDRTVIRLPKPIPLRLGALGLWRMVPELDDRPERVSDADWRTRIDEGRRALAALRIAKDDPSCWRTP